MKKILLIVAIIIGFSTSANAQFFQKLKEAYSTVKDAYDTGKSIYNDVNKNNETKQQAPEYTSLGSCSAIRFSGNTTIRTSLTMIEMSSGEKKILYGGGKYNYYDNPYYDSYSTDSSDRSYYKYYVDLSAGRTYFNR